MSRPARSEYPSYARSRGIALLMMLGIILIAFTTIAISRLSLSSGEQKARAKTTQALIQSRDAIMAFAIAPAAPNTNPPGTLPCPDTNGDGRAENLVANVCPNRRGLVPFLTLNIPKPLDGTGAPIWYVVADEYSRALVGAQTRNSSSQSTLRLNVTLPMAFILLAPNKPLGTQVRVNNAPSFNAVKQFLDGDNADATLDSYTNVRDDNEFDSVPDTQNDQVLGVAADDFWTSIEERVLTDVRNSLELYHSRCLTYPFAADYSRTGQSDSNDSLNGNREGRLPLETASPFGWGGNCGLKVAPQQPAPWIRRHWGDSLYYAMCLQSSLNCIRLLDSAGNNPTTVSALVMAPGALTTPTRTPGVRSDFYERENALLIPVDTYTQVKPYSHIGGVNDVIYIVP